MVCFIILFSAYFKKTCRFCGAYLVEIDDGEENGWVTTSLLKDVRE